MSLTTVYRDVRRIRIMVAVDHADAQARMLRWHVRSRPPQNQVPGLLPRRHLIASSPTTFVVLVEVRAYTTGVEIELALHGRADRATSFLPTDQRIAGRLHVPVAPTPDISLTAADGTPAVVLRGRELFDQLDNFADRPTLFEHGGGGNSDHMTTRLWLYPFPAETLKLGVAWPAQDIAPTTTTLTIDDLQWARDQIIELWPWRVEDELRGLGF